MATLSLPDPKESRALYVPQQRRNLSSVDFAARKAQQQRLRLRYLKEPWTRKECAIPGCGDQLYQLHHATYGQPQSTEMLALVPLCDFHHATFEHQIWPAVKDFLSRSLATIRFIVDGEALLEYVEWATPITVDDETHIDQLALWEVGP